MRPVSVDDLQNADDEFARGREIARRDGHRSTLAVPLIRDGRALGTINIRRTEIQPFEKKHIALLTAFAAQAVIAIENARLLIELRQRTTDLSESLEQQTATSEVLTIISRSPAELEPVFQAILANAIQLCGAKFGNLNLYDGEVFRIAAFYNVPPEYAEWRQQQLEFRPHPRGIAVEVVRTKQPVQINDVRTMPAYRERNPIVRALADMGGARTLLLVPMLKDVELVGMIGIYRKEVRPFTDRQIALVQNFADQRSSLSRILGCSTSCGNRWNNRRRRRMCCVSSVLHPPSWSLFLAHCW